jgi:hypothetical protein
VLPHYVLDTLDLETACGLSCTPGLRVEQDVNKVLCRCCLDEIAVQKQEAKEKAAVDGVELTLLGLSGYDDED